MKKIYVSTVASLALLSTACVTLPSGTLGLAGPAEGGATSLIRPAREEERQYKPSAAAKFFSVPAKAARLLQLWPAENLSNPTNLSAHEDVRVKPGSYLVKVECTVGGFLVYFDVPVVTQAGQDSLIECTGATANTARVTVHEKQGSEWTLRMQSTRVSPVASC